ncbi:MAG: histidine phosphatase family protein [Pirellulales bacterium]|nr:histidine phosphatase family protein [Pirellulales bacterium]
MLTIVLIRPGATDYDKHGRIQGTLDIPLNGAGSAEVSQLIEQLRGRALELLYTSDSEPALETASKLADGLDIKLKTLDDMQNLDHGLWQGMLVSEIRRKHPKLYRQWQEQPDSVCPPQGEMLEEARQRVQRSLRKLVKRHRDGVIGLVLPEPLASLARTQLCQCACGDLWKASDEHGHWEAIEVRPAELAAAR